MPTILEPSDIKRTTVAKYGVIGAEPYQRSAAIRFLPDAVWVYWEDDEINHVTLSGQRILKRRGPTNRESVTFYPRVRDKGRLDNYRGGGSDAPPEWLQEFVRDVVCPDRTGMTENEEGQ